MAAPVIGVRQRWVDPLRASVDRSHPLAVGMAHCFLWDGGSWTDVVTGIRMTRQSTGPTNGLTTVGRGGTVAANLGGAWAIVPPVTYPSSWTWRGTVPGNFTSSLSALFCHKVGTPDTTAEQAPYLMGIAADAGGTTPRLFAGYNILSFMTLNGGALTAGRLSTVTATATPGAQSIWTNGTLSASDTVTPMADPVMGSNLAYLCMNAYVSSQHAAATSVAGIYHRRVLSDVEIRTLHADPFCMLRQ